MNSKDSTIQPSKIASFLVELFAAPHEADGILGDLEEEFRAELARSGEAAARRQYRRQALRTVIDLAVAPWGRLIGYGIVGFVLSWPVGWSLGSVAEALVVNYPVYMYVPAGFFWSSVSLLNAFMTGVVIALAARAMKLRPMSVAVSTVAVIAIVLAVDRPIMLSLYGAPRGVTFTFANTLIRWTYGVVTFGGVLFLGAALGRTIPIRTKTLRPVS